MWERIGKQEKCVTSSPTSLQVNILLQRLSILARLNKRSPLF